MPYRSGTRYDVAGLAVVRQQNAARAAAKCGRSCSAARRRFFQRQAQPAHATALLTLLGAVGESLGMDRLLKSNTSKTRTYSLFRQGCMLYELIPNMPEHRLKQLMQTFAKAATGTGLFQAAIVASK